MSLARWLWQKGQWRAERRKIAEERTVPHDHRDMVKILQSREGIAVDDNNVRPLSDRNRPYLTIQFGEARCTDRHALEQLRVADATLAEQLKLLT